MGKPHEAGGDKPLTLAKLVNNSVHFFQGWSRPAQKSWLLLTLTQMLFTLTPMGRDGVSAADS
jgi:hypothetical protein